MSQRFTLTDAVVTDKLLGYYAGFFKRKPDATPAEAKAYAEQQLVAVDLARYDLNPWSHFAYLLQPKPDALAVQTQLIDLLADPGVQELIDCLRPVPAPPAEPVPADPPSQTAKPKGRK